MVVCKPCLADMRPFGCAQRHVLKERAAHGHHSKPGDTHFDTIQFDFDMFDVLGANWDPTNQKISPVNCENAVQQQH